MHGMADVVFKTLTADAAARYASKDTFLRLPGVVTVEVSGRHALEHMNLNEHNSFSFLEFLIEQLIKIITETNPVDRLRISLAHIVIECVAQSGFQPGAAG